MISDRITAFVATHIVLSFETQMLQHQSERKADLLRRAAALEAEGLTAPAADLKSQANLLSLEPLRFSRPVTEAEPTRLVTAERDDQLLPPQNSQSRIPHQQPAARSKPRRKAGKK